jgi:hypothetical protein
MILTTLLCFLALISYPQSNSWRSIVPLRSTRADVEKILGSPTPNSKATDAAYYRTENERVFILYSTGPCDVHPSNGWNIPRGTVIHMGVEPIVRPKFADLKLDASKYERRPDPELSDLTYYLNKDEGIGIEVNTALGVVTSIDYWPTAKDNSLRCPSSSFKPEVLQKSEPFSTGVSVKQKELLDCLMLRLKREASVTGWIRIDLEGTRVDQPALTDLVIHYLKSKYGAQFDRVAVMGAYRLAQEMELFIVPRNGDPIPFSEKTSKSKCGKRARSI